MPDFTPLRRSDETCFTDTIGGKVVVEHERLLALPFDGIDDLGVTRRAERGHDDGLRFASGKQRRAIQC